MTSIIKSKAFLCLHNMALKKDGHRHGRRQAQPGRGGDGQDRVVPDLST